MTVEEYKTILAFAKREIGQDPSIPKKLVDSLEIIAQIASYVPKVGGNIGFIKELTDNESKAKLLILCPSPDDVSEQVCLEFSVPIEYLNLIGPTLDVFNELQFGDEYLANICDDYAATESPVEECKVLKFRKIER